MSGEVLREAAALMRERAEAAICPCDGPACTVANGGVREDEMTARFDGWTRVVDHYVGMSPAVALAVADWLDGVANLVRNGRHDKNEVIAALTVARAYLGT